PITAGGAVRIGIVGVIENVKGLKAELRFHALPEVEILADREVYVAETRVSKNVPPHGAKSSHCVRQEDRSAIETDIAAARATCDGCREGSSHRASIRCMRRTQIPSRGSLCIRQRDSISRRRVDICAAAGGAAHAKRHRIWSRRLEIGRIAKEVPAISVIAGSAKVIGLIVDIPGLPALHGDDAVDLPALKKLALGLFLGQRIGYRKRETMTNVFVAAGMFQIRTSAVHGKESNPVRRHIIQSMRISVAQDKIESVIVAGRQRVLPTVVCRAVGIRQIVDEIEVRVLSSVGLSGASSCNIGLVKIDNSCKLCTVISHIRRFERDLTGERMLDA